MSIDEAVAVELAWEQFLIERGQVNGWNPRKVFEAGWDARGGDSK